MTVTRTLALALLLAASAPATAAAQQLPDRELRAALKAWADAPNHHGVSAAIITRDGKLWTAVAGEAVPGRAVSERELMHIASVTKTMTGALILTLVDAGKLSLSDPISKWLPPVRNVAPTITIRQLLNHTSGVANYPSNPAYAQSVAGRATPLPMDSVLQFVGAPLYAPGTSTTYGNTAFILLGQIAERVTGQKLPRLLRERLWKPLGITEIFLAGSERPVGPLAHAMAQNGPSEHTPRLGAIGSSHGAAAAIATPTALAQWGHGLFTGKLISDSLQRQMRTLVPAAGNIPGESGAGLSIRAYNYLGRTQYGHSGGSPLTSTLMVHDPQTGATIAIIMTQSLDAGHFELMPTLLRIVSGG